MSSYKQGYKPGDWKAVCDVCGFTYKASELKDRWDGLKVCDKDWESRHPLDFIKGPKGEKPLPWTRSEPADQFTTVNYVAESVGTQDLDIPEGHFGTSSLLLENGEQVVLYEEEEDEDEVLL